MRGFNMLDDKVDGSAEEIEEGRERGGLEGSMVGSKPEGLETEMEWWFTTTQARVRAAARPDILFVFILFNTFILLSLFCSIDYNTYYE